MRLAIIVKYLLPDERRISGVASFASILLDRLACDLDLHVFTQCTEEQAGAWSRDHTYATHAVGGNFWLRVGGEVARNGADCSLTISGLHKSRLFYPMFRPLAARLPGRKIFYQAVCMDRPLGALGRRVLRKFSAVAATTQNIAYAFGALAQPCAIVPPGIDVDRIRALKPAQKGRPFRVGYFNHLNKVKGCDIALNAFAAMPFDDTEYVIAGTGEMEREIRAKSDGRGGIRFLGYLCHPMAELKACDAVVLPFRTSVSVLGVSQAAIACLAAGVPVIGADTESITSAVRHEQEGLIFKRPDGLAPCIARLHDEPALREQLARNAALRVEDFRVDESARRMREVILS